jgi:hypothetical protein
VNILILRNSYTMSYAHVDLGLTSLGSFIMVSGNGASIMKFPLSETTGPAFILPIRSLRPGSPSPMLYGDPRSARLRSTLA